MLSVDLNCDMGEGMENDEAIMPFISSVNIACGYHAGDEVTMRRTVELALHYGVAIGAHPSYPDREHFGRIDMLGDGLGRGAVGSDAAVPDVTFDNLSEIITDQIHILRNICVTQGGRLDHVKAHGALYNRAARDPRVSAILCEAIRQFDPSLVVYGLSGSVMRGEAERCGLRFVSEVFADRTYRTDGSLTPRTEPGALIEDPREAVAQVLGLIREGKALTIRGRAISLAAETICIHGDRRHAAVFAQLIHESLVKNGISIEAP